MTVKQLIIKLQKLNQDAEVIMSSDEEGNEFNPLTDIATEYNYDTANNEIGLAHLTKELKDQGYTKEDDLLELDPPNVVSAIIFFP